MAKSILEKKGEAKVEPVTKEFNLTYFDLKEYATGKDIEKALPKKHLFDVADVYAVIGNLISKQMNKEEGPLLTDGNYNVFYTEKFCVSVHWFDFDGFWFVRCWSRGKDWLDANRVFSPGV